MRLIQLFTFLAICICTLAQQQSVWLTTRMDGVHDLGWGNNTTIWGFGHDSLGTITLPAPLLEFNLGDSVEIHMVNNSAESHTIHLHGLDVDQANDGVPQTSFYIIGNDTGTYRFSANHAGTFLYHCHVTTTLHLTLGMYGMIAVNAPNNELYPGGPSYDAKYHFLTSDLEEETNDNPLDAFPFHEIYPDHFMVNGLAGPFLASDSANIIFSEPGDRVLLRLGSMAYSRIKYKFPAGSNPTVHMSDGRPLPATFNPTELDIYPGERYSVLLEPDTGFTGQLEVEYYNMINDNLVGLNLIAINRIDLGVSDNNNQENNFSVYPNPASSSVFIPIKNNQETIELFNVNGKLVKTITAQKGLFEMPVRDFSERGIRNTNTTRSLVKIVASLTLGLLNIESISQSVSNPSKR